VAAIIDIDDLPASFANDELVSVMVDGATRKRHGSPPA
jgi:hypothetical protein